MVRLYTINWVSGSGTKESVSVKTTITLTPTWAVPEMLFGCSVTSLQGEKLVYS